MHQLTADPTNPLTLAEAGADDLPALVTLLHVAYAEFLGKIDPPSGAHSETIATLGEKLRTARAIKAQLGVDLVGCIFLEFQPTHLYFSRLAVLPAYRQMGIGRQLVAYAETEARRYNLPCVTLNVRLSIPANMAYYTTLGYQVIGYGSHTGYNEPTFAHMAKTVI